MARTNRYAGTCRSCNKRVEAEQGVLVGPPWGVECAVCNGTPVAQVAPPPPVKVRVSLNGSMITFKLEGFLGPDRFDIFRHATSAAKYSKDRGCNDATLEKAVGIVENLRQMDFNVVLDPDAAAALQAQASQIVARVEDAGERAEEIDQKLRTRGLLLFPFQKTGIRWLASKAGALLSDEMGLGKTIQTLIATPDSAPILVIGPAAAKAVWLREAAKWRPDLRVTVLKGRGSFRWPEAGEMVILNYDIQPETVPEGCPKGLLLVGDEIHALKSSKSQRTKRFRALADHVRKRGGRVWGLTATPLLNKPPELWAILTAIGVANEAFGTWLKFVDAHRGSPGAWGGYEWGVPNAAMVAACLKKVSLRRTKKEVLPELPEKMHRTLTVDLDSATKKLCDAVVKHLATKGIDFSDVTELAKGTRASLPGFEELAKARAALASAKIPFLLDLVEEYEEQEEPLVVFSAHRAPIDILGKRPGWAAITGDTSTEERGRIETEFQAGKLKGVAATIQAGGVAITLTRASNEIFVDRAWTPALNDQAEDRCHRIGTTRGVLITGLVGDHALDRRVDQLLSIKKTIIDNSVEASNRKASEDPTVLPSAEYASITRLESGSYPIAKVNGSNGHVKATNGSVVKAVRRPPSNPVEEWAVDALRTLTGLDPDNAMVKNEEGFNRLDGPIGKSLAMQLEAEGLTDKQWVLAITLCRKYRRQVGLPPQSP